MSDDSTTVAWTVIKPKWKVISADGVEIGEVYMTVGDDGADIFDGLAITHYGGPAFVHGYTDRPRYVRADQVECIQQGAVRLTITAQESAQLPEHDVPESARILPESASIKERIETDIGKHTGRRRS